MMDYAVYQVTLKISDGFSYQENVWHILGLIIYRSIQHTCTVAMIEHPNMQRSSYLY